MPDSFRLDSSDLLSYNSMYRVIICRECQYAIQKSAVQSHLLRHKIYREDRQQLVYMIEQLDLPEPEEVDLPPKSSPPIDGLPVIPGLRCTIADCGSLCASIKRMKRHQNDMHDAPEPSKDGVNWTEVSLQTFFKGTKIKYFEVNSTWNVPPQIVTPPPRTQKSRNLNQVRSIRADHEQVTVDIEMTWPDSDSHIVEPLNNQPHSSHTASIDLEVLAYFNHFLTVASVVLPTSIEQSSYWRQDLVARAFQPQEWIMHGLLAISTAHRAIHSGDSATARRQRERSKQYSEQFHSVWEIKNAQEFTDDLIRAAGIHISCMIHCSYWAMQDIPSYEMTPSELSMPFSLEDFMDLVRNTAFNDAIPDEDDQATMFAEGREILNTLPKDHVMTSSFLATPSETRINLLERIRTLTYRISETLGKPANVHDVVATLAALSALVVSTEASFVVDDASSTWRAMALWLVKVPDYFRSMLRQGDPTGLVLVAHWAWLIKRAEDCGCWFVRGMARRVFIVVEERLKTESSGVQELICGMRDGVL